MKSTATQLERGGKDATGHAADHCAATPCPGRGPPGDDPDRDSPSPWADIPLTPAAPPQGPLSLLTLGDAD